MAEGRVQILIRIYKDMIKTGSISDDTVKLLGDIIQLFVLRYDYQSACKYQGEKCKVLRRLYGKDDIAARVSEVYRRELCIRSAPVSDRVAMCRLLWEDVKREFGARDDVSALTAQLYVMCCFDAKELEELRILCGEIKEIFKDAKDETGKQLAALGEGFGYMCGEESLSAESLKAACAAAADRFGTDSEYTILMMRALGVKYRQEKNGDSLKKALKIHRKCRKISMNVLGVENRITLMLMKDIIMDLAMTGKTDKALKLAHTLQKACEKAGSDIEKPDVDECYSLIYLQRGKSKKAEKYAQKSISENIKRYGGMDSDTLNRRMNYAIALSMRGRYEKAVRYMSDVMARKEEYLYGIFLSDSEARREAYFKGNGTKAYGAYLAMVIMYNSSCDIPQDLLCDIWENICNYKNLLGDCEFLHNILEKREEFGKRSREADPEMGQKNEREVMEAYRAVDFRSFVKDYHVSQLCKILKPGEILLDYYMTSLPDFEYYTVITATRRGVRFYKLDDISRTDADVEAFLKAIHGGDIKVKNPENSSDLTGGAGLTSGAGPANGSGLANESAPVNRLGIDKIFNEAGKYTKIYICPDGLLYRMPFETLVPKGGSVLYLTNVKDLIRTRMSGDAGNISRPPRKVSVFADPAFELSESMDMGQERYNEAAGNRLLPLPGTYVEAEIIRELYEDDAELHLHMRNDANAAIFMEDCGADILHIGAHAGTDNEGTIWLAGANNVRDGADVGEMYGRGFVTSADIVTLDLSQTELVMLSACRTALGEYRNWLGVRGLRRAFKLAGAKRVIASLWELNDMATAIFIKKFYEYHKNDKDAETALRMAKTYMRTATAETIKKEDLPSIAKILVAGGHSETWRELRDTIGSCSDGDTPFSRPYNWAGLIIYE